jgi:hypothetical protein
MSDVESPTPERLPESVAEATGQFPTFLVDSIAKILAAQRSTEDEDILAALKAWGDMRGLRDRAARITVAGGTGPEGAPGALLGTTFEAGKVNLHFDRTILLADTAHYGTRTGEQPDVHRHERVFKGRTYTVALLHRDEAAKIAAITEEAHGPRRHQA